MDRRERIRGCLLGGALGDALGAAVEFLEWEEIVERFGPAGLRAPAAAYGRLGAVSDDTQMVLFTAEGLLRAQVRGGPSGLCDAPAMVHQALLRWLLTQGIGTALPVPRDGWLIGEGALWSRRGPGQTCLAALSRSRRLGESTDNESKGCGALVRSAPCAFFPPAFELARDSARLTHGHPTGYLAAALFADILQRLLHADLPGALRDSLAQHGALPGMQETRLALEQVMRWHAEGRRPTPAALASLGNGWLASSALAIGVWCALAAPSVEQGLLWAVNQGGDSDACGLVTGQLLGIQQGTIGLPQAWLAQLELREQIERIADDLQQVPLRVRDRPDDPTLGAQYPGR